MIGRLVALLIDRPGRLSDALQGLAGVIGAGHTGLDFLGALTHRQDPFFYDPLDIANQDTGLLTSLESPDILIKA